MFQGLDDIAVPEEARGRDGLRRVGWAELAAAISLSRRLHSGEQGLLARAGPSFDGTESKEERGVNLSSLARRKAPGGNAGSSASLSPRRHRENT